LADALGGPRGIFSVVFLFSFVNYHRSDPTEYLTISLAWALFVALRPLETLAELWRRWGLVWTDRRIATRLGEVVCHEAPNILVLQEDPMSSAQFGEILLARTESGDPGLVIALDQVGFAGGRWRRAIVMNRPSGDANALYDASLAGAVSDGSVFRLDSTVLPDQTMLVAHHLGNRLIGIVASDSDISQLQIELVRTDVDLHEGSLVEVEVRDNPVLCQIINGLTKEEVLRERNARGFVRAHAKKIGRWNQVSCAFDPVPWLPLPNQPVLVANREDGELGAQAVGCFPATTYPITIDPHLLVTQNAAILGILGVGKTFLALELIERMLAVGIKVVCLDLTDQYATELGSFLDEAAEAEVLKELEAVGPPGKSNVQQNVEEGGSARVFAAKVGEQIEAFLKPDSKRSLMILNPAQFEVWRQDSRPFNNNASMAALTPTEITRIITEALLKTLQSKGMTESARCCIVYEEAHSLIPEWNAVSSEGDRAATNGTAKAILQGRKFGLGCLVITQRTANVTKSILNQCNTVFALRVFDATGMEFLKNYVGEDYASILSTLDDRHAVVFGRASSCRDPVLTRLNDRADFLRRFRPVPTTEIASTAG
ncbi:MAG: DUF87 domain-containing protein, partial [Chloroflexota bacterium]